MQSHIPWSLILLLATVAVCGSGYSLFARYAGLTPLKAFAAWVVAVASGIIAGSLRYRVLRELHADPDALVLGSVSAGLFLFLATAFILRVRGKWLETAPSDPENSVGVTGFRAWFALGNLFVAALLTFLAWFGFGIPLAVTLVVTCGLLAVKPLLTVNTSAAIASESDHRSVEREKILALLECGRITADESAELLNALATTDAKRPVPPLASSPSRRLALVGAAVVLAGFFLPWFSFSPGAELSRIVPQLPTMPALSLPGTGSFPFATPSLHVAGGDVGKGLGWMVLVLAFLAAFGPNLGRAWDRTTRRTVQMLALTLGSIIVIYLLTSNVRLVSIGLVLAAGGYILEWAAFWREDGAELVQRLSRAEGA